MSLLTFFLSLLFLLLATFFGAAIVAGVIIFLLDILWPKT